jgi:hypothetical protein
MPVDLFISKLRDMGEKNSPILPVGGLWGMHQSA